MHVLRLLVPCCLLLAMVGCRRGAEPPPEVPIEELAKIPVKPADTFSVEVSPTSLRLEPGLTAKLKVTTGRRGPIHLELRNLPPGVTAKPTTIGARESSGEIELSAGSVTALADMKNVQVVASGGGVEARSRAFTISVVKPSFSLTIDPSHVKLPQGSSRQLRVAVNRPAGYDLPIKIELTNLPKNVTARRDEVARPGRKLSPDVFEFTLQASTEAKTGDSTPQIQTTPANDLKTGTPFKLTIQGPPAELVIEPARINLVYGRSTKVKVVAKRSKDYQGTLQLLLDNLPPHVKAKPVTLSPEQSEGEIELTATSEAISSERKIQLRASSADYRQSTLGVDLKVEGKPFVLRPIEPKSHVAQGGASAIKIAAVRSKDFSGRIELELRNLPKDWKALSAGIGLQAKDGEIDIIVPADAPAGDLTGVQLVGIATIAGDKREVPFGNIILHVLGPFALHVQPARIEMLGGDKSLLKVRAERRTYKGPIALEVRGLPAGVTATKAEIAKDQDSVDLEVTASAKAGGPDKTDVHVVGSTSTNKQVISPNFTVAVGRKLFDLKVASTQKVTFGSKTPLRVTAVRKEYSGAIALELKNLPPQVKAVKTIIQPGQNDTDIELITDDQARETKAEVQIVGTALQGSAPTIFSKFTLQVVPGLFDLKVEPAIVTIHHGGTAKVKVTALRKGYDGAIPIELRNLPKAMKAEKALIAKGEDRTEIELKAEATAIDGDKIDVYARGTATVPNKSIDSPRFTVSVVSIGQPPGVELKVEPAVIKLSQGQSVKVRISAIRKGFTGPLAVELRNLPADVESSRGKLTAEQSAVEITLTAGAKAEPGTRGDVCAIGFATMGTSTTHASPHITLQVVRK